MKLSTLLLTAAMLLPTGALAGDYTTLQTEKIQNPMLWADVPDPDVIRVGDTFYLVSTTMHLMPGAPIMKSKDLKNWETVGYIFDRLTDSPKYDLLEGTAYGRGQWATSLKYHNGKFYALLAPNEQGAMGDTYIFTADKAEGPWKILSRMRHFHDCSLFFDDDNRVYVIPPADLPARRGREGTAGRLTRHQAQRQILSADDLARLCPWSSSP